MKEGGKKTRRQRWMGSPWVLAAVVGGFAVANVMTLWEWEGLVTPTRMQSPLLIERTAGGMVVRDPNEESWDAATQAMSATDGKAWVVQLEVELEWFGFPAKMGAMSRYGLTSVPRIEDVELRRMVMKSAAEEYGKRGAVRSERLRGRLEGGEARGVEWRWRGVWLNGLVVVMVLALVNGWLRWMEWSVERRKQKRVELRGRGICPDCGYEVGGLEVCPECGKARAWPGGAEL